MQDCKGSNIVMSVPGFGELTGLNYDINPTALIQWQPTSCSPQIEGGRCCSSSSGRGPGVQLCC